MAPRTGATRPPPPPPPPLSAFDQPMPLPPCQETTLSGIVREPHHTFRTSHTDNRGRSCGMFSVSTIIHDIYQFQRCEQHGEVRVPRRPTSYRTIPTPRLSRYFPVANKHHAALPHSALAFVFFAGALCYIQ